MDGKISDDEIPDFTLISTKLDEISTASDVLRLWIEKTIQVNKLNGKLFILEPIQQFAIQTYDGIRQLPYLLLTLQLLCQFLFLVLYVQISG